jgi:hypothetical protein
MTEDRRKTPVWLIGAGVIVHQRCQQRAASDIIVKPWDRLGGQQWLKPNLRHARLVIPDRPHSL